MAIELFIFDWSGTISDDKKPVYEANMKILESHGISRVPFEEWLNFAVQNASEYLFRQGINKNYQELMKLYCGFYEEEVKSGNKPYIYPEAKEILKSIQDGAKDLAVLSSHPIVFLLKEAKQYGIEDCFAMIEGSIRDKVAGLEAIYNALGYPKEETAYIGDAIYDVRSAKKLGLVSIAVCGGYNSKDMLEREKPDFLLENLAALKSGDMPVIKLLSYKI